MVIGAEITLPDGTMNFGEKSCYNSLQAQLVNGLADKLLDEISPNKPYILTYRGIIQTFMPWDMSEKLSASIRIDPLKDAPLQVVVRKVDDDTVEHQLPKDKTFWQRFIIAIKYLFGKELDAK